jgi:YegS/Rv2252/BmrU family lipid kinase
MGGPHRIDKLWRMSLGPLNAFRGMGDNVQTGQDDQRHREPAVFIVNPRAGAGKAGRSRIRLKKAIERHFSDARIIPTEHPRHATELARRACDEGARTVVAVGGDGTCHEVVQGLLGQDGQLRSEVVFATVPQGTGSDLQKSLGLPPRLDDMMRVAATGHLRRWDVGRVTMGDDNPKVEYFINVAGFGANGEVVRRANRMSKAWGGLATFYIATVQTAFSYDAPVVHLRWEAADGVVHEREADVLSAFLANGAFCGGGMDVGNAGRPDDGLFDITILPPDPFVIQLMRSRRLYDGSLHAWPGVRQFKARWLEARVVDGDKDGDEALIDLDGEQPGRLPARFDVLPGCLPIRCTAES